MDAAGDGEVLAVLDLRPDDSLAEAGLAREVRSIPPHVCLFSHIFIITPVPRILPLFWRLVTMELFCGSHKAASHYHALGLDRYDCLF